MPDIKLKGWSGAEWEHKNVPKVWLNAPESTEENPVKVPFTYGEAVHKNIDPDFSTGNMNLAFPEGELVTSLTVNQPPNLLPENIPKGMYIAGVGPGEFEGNSTELPKLFGPGSVGYNTLNGLKRISVYDNDYNGDFHRQAQIVSADGSIVYCTGTDTTTSGYQYFYGYNFLRKPSQMPFEVYARFVGDKFEPSDPVKASTTFFLVELLHKLIGCSLNNDYKMLFFGDAVALKIVPNSGFYYPKAISIEPSEGEIEYTYNPLTGDFSIPSLPQISTVTITAEAPDMPWLQNPELTFGDNTITVDFIDGNAESTPVTHNGEALFSLTDNRTGYISHETDLKPTGASYGFTLQADGYYLDESSGGYYRAALCKVEFNMKTSGTVKFSIINYGYSSTDYGIISKVDCVLSSSYSTDIDTSSSNVSTTYKSSNSTSVKTYSMTIPAGKHFVYLKYRRYNQSSTSYYFKFKVSSVPPEKTDFLFSDYLMSYGTYPLLIQSIAEGYTPSDAIHYTYEYWPYISVKNGALFIENLLSSITQIEIVIDGVVMDTLEYSGSGSVSVDLASYALSMEQHTVYVNVLLGTEIYQSNVLEDEALFEWVSFADATWEYIDNVSQKGFASKVFNIGDTKTVTYNGSNIVMAIADFNVDDLADGSGKAGITLVGLNTAPVAITAYNNSSSATTNSAYEIIAACLDNTIMSGLSSEFTSVLKSVKKAYDDSKTTSYKTIVEMSCKLFAPSLTELNIEKTKLPGSGWDDTRCADLGGRYKLFEDTSLTIRTSGSTSGYSQFWVRNSYKTGYSCPIYVYISGTTKTGGFINSTSTAKNILFGCCI